MFNKTITQIKFMHKQQQQQQQQPFRIKFELATYN